jgi:hypothetical protein
MGKRADLRLAETTGLTHFSGGGTTYLVQTLTGAWYFVYVDALADIAYVKSTDGGFSWGNPVTVFTGSVTALSVWYDRWSNISAGLIHCAYTESVTDDTLYRTINTESSDALSTQTVVFAGASTATGGMLSIARAVGGNVYCRTTIDAGAEGGFFRLPNANVPNGAWDAARTIDEALATIDQMILLPDYDAADTQDMLAIFWDASADQISRKLYDDSGNSWSETSIATTMTDQVATTAFPHFAVAMDITNTRHILVAWSAVDTLNADLRCWTVDSGAITEVTNVVLNSTDDQGLCGICLDTLTGYWWVYYGGASGGGETFLTSINIYCKCSTDSGSTWGAETLLTTITRDITWLTTVPRILFGCPVPPPVAYHNDVAVDALFINVSLAQPAARLRIGL